MCVFCFLALRTGGAFAYFGLTSSDTCWLLRLGELITTTGAIPKSDPFTFTMPITSHSGDGPPYVVYQWLSEVVFFCFAHWFGLPGLLAFGAMVTALAFLCVPLRCCLRANAPTIWILFVVAAASVVDNLRSVIRPEVFTNIFLGIYLLLLQGQRQQLDAVKKGTGGVNWKTVACLAAIMTMWCNAHTGFVSGLLLLAIYALSFYLDDVVQNEPMSGATKTVIASFIGCILASLVNPYGISLWLYLPHLFFAKVNAQISELGPLEVGSLGNFGYLPLVGLLIICYGAIGRSLYKGVPKFSSLLKSPARASSIVIVVIASIMCFCTRRLVTLSSLLILVETANFIGAQSHSISWLRSFFQRKVSYLTLELVVIILAANGALTVAPMMGPLYIPFQADKKISESPIKAVDAFTRIYKGGHIFASVEIGSMLDLYLGPCSSNFIDSRLDAFNQKTINEYGTISRAEQGWQQLLDRYQIEWIFVFSRHKIARVLKNEPGWKLIYEDHAASIFQRQPVPLSYRAGQISNIKALRD